MLIYSMQGTFKRKLPMLKYTAIAKSHKGAQQHSVFLNGRGKLRLLARLSSWLRVANSRPSGDGSVVDLCRIE